MNKQLSYLLQHRVKRKKGDTTRLAAQLAPLEEQRVHNATEQGDSGHSAIATQEYGAIVVDNENVHLSGDIMEGEAGNEVLRMEPVVLVILALMLAFIAFVAWQISLMPSE